MEGNASSRGEYPAARRKAFNQRGSDDFPFICWRRREYPCAVDGGEHTVFRGNGTSGKRGGDGSHGQCPPGA